MNAHEAQGRNRVSRFMIYATLNVYQGYMAFVTADDEAGFRDVFRDLVLDCLQQAERWVGRAEKHLRERIMNDMAVLQPISRDQWAGFAYDLRFDVQGRKGIIEVTEVFLAKENVIERFQPWVDECNEGIDNDEEKWAVFDGGFFHSTQGYEIDELFK